MKKSNFCVKSVRLLSLPSVYVAVFAMLFTFSSCSDDDDDDVDDSVSISDDDDVDDSASISDDDDVDDSVSVSDDDDVDDSASVSDDDDADDSASVDDGYEASGTINGHEYVNLGLSVLWATCNIGADSPEDYGDYFAWGETETKDLFYIESEVTFLMTNISGNATYDAATANWGDSWRMPTHDEMKELVVNCTWIWMTQNDVNGYLVTGSTGNSIFLPAAGYHNDPYPRTEESRDSLYYAGEVGCYWSSSIYNASFAYSLGIQNGFHDLVWGRAQGYGQSVRPVADN